MHPYENLLLLFFLQNLDIVLTTLLCPYQKAQMEVDFSKYPSKEEREKQFSEIIMEEIKRKDPEFYDKWCNFES